MTSLKMGRGKVVDIQASANLMGKTHGKKNGKRGREKECRKSEQTNIHVGFLTVRKAKNVTPFSGNVPFKREDDDAAVAVTRPGIDEERG